MHPNRPHLLFMEIVQYKVSIQSAPKMFGTHTRHIKDLIYKLEFAQQDKNKQKKMIEYRNQYQITLRSCDLLYFKFCQPVIHPMGNETCMLRHDYFEINITIHIR